MNAHLLDADLSALIRPYTGPVLAAEPTARGHRSDFTAVTCERGPFFVKAMVLRLHPRLPDVPTVTELVARIGTLDLPERAREWPETRWDRYAAVPAHTALFRGDALLHTDLNPATSSSTAKVPGWSTGPGPRAEQPSSTQPAWPSNPSPQATNLKPPSR